jgi:hypothetical protein
MVSKSKKNNNKKISRKSKISRNSKFIMSGGMTLYVRLPTGQTIPLDVVPSDTIEIVRTKLDKILTSPGGWAAGQEFAYRLRFGQKYIDTDINHLNIPDWTRTLADYGIDNDNTIHLSLMMSNSPHFSSERTKHKRGVSTVAEAVAVDTMTASDRKMLADFEREGELQAMGLLCPPCKNFSEMRQETAQDEIDKLKRELAHCREVLGRKLARN